MKINKTLSTAIVLSLMLGVYGNASADDLLYGAESGNVPGVAVNAKGVTTNVNNATNSGTNYTVESGNWNVVYGGYSEIIGIDSQDNKVTIGNGVGAYGVTGGQALDGNANNNEVIIYGTVAGVVEGGSASRTTTTANPTEANYNIVTIKGTVNGDVYGGNGSRPAHGSADDNISVIGNSVTISGIVQGKVAGGRAEYGTANGNTVTISGGEIGSASSGIYGGYVYEGAREVKNNTITISNGTINSGAIVVGTRVKISEGSTVEKNILNITGGTFANLLQVGGGHGDIATGNEVYIKNATINSSISNLYGGWGDTKASDNILVIEDSRIDSNGAFVAGGDSNGEANNNEVTIAGKNIVVGTVVGGKGLKEAKDNIVNFGVYEAGKAEGIANVTGTVYGGNATTSTGNTLNVYTVGNKVGSLQKFQNMNFYIPKEAAVGDVLVESSANINLANVKVLAGFHNDTTLTNGDKVKLIKAPEVNGFDGVSTDKVAESDFTNFDIRVYQGDDTMDQVTSGTATSLVAEIVGKEANENSKSLVETIAVGTAIIAEGGDLLAGAGLANAQTALANDTEQGAPAGSATLFGAINANKSKIKSGSHVDVKGMNLNLGLVKEIKNNAGKFIVGPVVEYGKGKYDSYLDNGYHGEGDSQFVGGGLVAKQNNNNGMYYEGSVRAGKLMSDYKSNGGNYDSDSTYLAAHLGLGKVVKLNEKSSLDYYGKYFYSHQGSDDTTLHSALDHALHFDGVDSHRTRLGGRLNHVVKENNEVYIGFAWQHEFSSTARATIDGLGTPAPSCKGDTGIMELGWKVSETNKYDVDLGATGSIGKKKGAGINLSFNYKF